MIDSSCGASCEAESFKAASSNAAARMSGSWTPGLAACLWTRLSPQLARTPHSYMESWTRSSRTDERTDPPGFRLGSKVPPSRRWPRPAFNSISQSPAVATSSPGSIRSAAQKPRIDAQDSVRQQLATILYCRLLIRNGPNEYAKHGLGTDARTESLTDGCVVSDLFLHHPRHRHQAQQI